MNAKEATKLLEEAIQEGSKIKSTVDYGDHFLFIVHRPDPLEGTLDPFFSVNKKTRLVRDFSPQDYPNPVDVINKLKAAYVD